MGPLVASDALAPGDGRKEQSPGPQQVLGDSIRRRPRRGSEEDSMGFSCELFGHCFEQPAEVEAARSSDGVLMVHDWACRMCGADVAIYEPMDAFIARVAEWADRSGGSKLPPPAWLGPPKPARFARSRARTRAPAIAAPAL